MTEAEAEKKMIKMKSKILFSIENWFSMRETLRQDGISCMLQ
jgi:protein associated with RNAse G/E